MSASKESVPQEQHLNPKHVWGFRVYFRWFRVMSHEGHGSGGILSSGTVTSSNSQDVNILYRSLLPCTFCTY